MGMFTVVLISHDGLDAIENDPNFGKNISAAINQRRYVGVETVSIPAGNYSNPAEVIGHSFHTSDPQFVVIEGGTGWIAYGQEKPSWSQITKGMIRRCCAGVKN